MAASELSLAADSWTSRGTAAFTRTDAVAPSGMSGIDPGDDVLLITTVATRFAVGDTVRLVHNEAVPITPGQWAHFGVRGWASQALDTHVGVEFLDASGDPIGVQVWGNMSHCYLDTGGDMYVSAEAPADAALVRPRIEGRVTAAVIGQALLAYFGNLFLNVSDVNPVTSSVNVTPRTTGDPRAGRLPWDRDPWILEYDGTYLEFGTLATGIVMHEAPDYGAREFTTEDQQVPRGDGRTFGQDYLTGQTITFTLAVNGRSESECRSRVAQVSRAWRGDAVRFTSGAVATLTDDVGALRYGRPRRFTVDRAEMPLGVAIVTCDFETATDCVYSNAEHSESITYYPNLGGGLVAPLAAPLSTTLSSDRSRVFEIGGDVETWPIFEIAGPIANPVIEIVGVLRMELQTTLAEGQRVTIDTRPFKRSILRSDRASLAGTLTRKSTRLSQAALSPGRYEMVLRGTSRGRIATATIRWHDAYSDI